MAVWVISRHSSVVSFPIFLRNKYPEVENFELGNSLPIFKTTVLFNKSHLMLTLIPLSI